MKRLFLFSMLIALSGMAQEGTRQISDVTSTVGVAAPDNRDESDVAADLTETETLALENLKAQSALLAQKYQRLALEMMKARSLPPEEWRLDLQGMKLVKIPKPQEASKSKEVK